MQEVLAELRRGNGLESVHYGSIVVADNTGRVLFHAGDPDLWTFTRSSAKPFQAVPLLERGGLDKFGFDLAGIAIMCGSHAGSERHVEQVQRNLDRIGLDESYLQCGVHPPLDYTTKGILPRREETFRPLQHNCSGKHSGQLALARLLGCDPKRYLELNYTPQQTVLAAFTEICGIPKEQILIGTDGCSLPNFCVTLRHLARGYANIASLQASTPERAAAFRKIIEAIQAHPFMVSGEGRSDLALMQALPTEIICKVGGEAIQGMAILTKGWGLAAKIADGNARALGPVVVEALRQLGVLPDARLPFVEKFVQPRQYNNRNIDVGYIRPVFKLKEA